MKIQKTTEELINTMIDQLIVTAKYEGFKSETYQGMLHAYRLLFTDEEWNTEITNKLVNAAIREGVKTTK